MPRTGNVTGWQKMLSGYFNSDEADEDALDEATARLFQVKRGMPTHRQFMRMMEDAKIRKRFEKFDLEMNSDYNKERAHNLKEELHYVIDEKNQQADLTESGRGLISPSDPEGFVIPDLATTYVEIDRKKDLSAMRKSARSANRRRWNFRQRASGFTRSPNCCVPMPCTRKTRSMWCRGAR